MGVNQTSPGHSFMLWFGAFSSALPCLYLSWVLFNVWRDPMAWDDGNWVRLGVGLLLLEFVLLHSGAFLGAMVARRESLPERLKLIAGLMAFYTLMVWGFSMALDSEQLLWIFAAVSIGRLITVITSSPDGAEAMTRRSGFGVLVYLLVVFGTVFLPIPELGIDSRVLSEVYPDRGSGLWEREPERAIAGAAVYFALIGLAELFILRPKAKSANTFETGHAD